MVSSQLFLLLFPDYLNLDVFFYVSFHLNLRRRLSLDRRTSVTPSGHKFICTILTTSHSPSPINLTSDTLYIFPIRKDNVGLTYKRPSISLRRLVPGSFSSTVAQSRYKAEGIGIVATNENAYMTEG
jgi:hypothetical protein